MTIANIYFTKLNENGSIFFTKVDEFVKEFMNVCKKKGIIVKLENHNSFVTVTKISEVKKEVVKFSNSVEYSKTHDMSFGVHKSGWKALVCGKSYVYGDTKAECTNEARKEFKKIVR